MSFSTFNLHPKLLSNIEGLGFTIPTEIQQEVIPEAIAGKDISGLSRTGTGKTCAFLIPTLHRLANSNPESLALCLAPTRELALQIVTEANKLSTGLAIDSVCLVGGMPATKQIELIQKGARLLVGTPGRIIDLMKERVFNPQHIQFLVFDEADRMFDMGFIDDMRFIMRKIPENRQILLFSATMNFSVLNMMYEFGSDPVEFNISRDQITAEGIQQKIFHVGHNEKKSALLAICRKIETGGIIVFVNYKEQVYFIANLLAANNIPAKAISSLLRQDRRNQIINNFRSGKFQALVATDVASRGLDIDDVSLVVNYHLPEEAANYVHRIGRTARAGKSGLAVSIAGPEDAYNQLRIEEFLGYKIPVEWLSDEELDTNVIYPEEDKDTDRMTDGVNSKTRERSSKGHSNNRRSGNNTSNNKNSRRGNRPNPSKQSRYSRNRPTNKSQSEIRSREGNESPANSNATTDATALPYPITGSPKVYCTKTGKVKANPSNAPSTAVNDENKANILKKIGSTVSSIFSKK